MGFMGKTEKIIKVRNKPYIKEINVIDGNKTAKHSGRKIVYIDSNNQIPQTQSPALYRLSDVKPSFCQ
jgi:hypothetical protein